MSRARSVTVNGDKIWFDVHKNHRKATDEQLELLATAEGIELDDLVEATVTQGDVLLRLREALGELPIPEHVLEKRREWRAERQTQPPCRLCGKIGDSTKHHFVNKWILKELEDYNIKWANRGDNCIPVCIHCHRDLHDRSNGPVSIADYLTDEEKDFANRAINKLSEERPKLLILIAKGSPSVYEACLIQDWLAGKFDLVEDRPAEPPEVLRQIA